MTVKLDDSFFGSESSVGPDEEEDADPVIPKITVRALIFAQILEL